MSPSVFSFVRRITLMLAGSLLASAAFGQPGLAPLPGVASYADRIEVRHDIVFGTEPYQKMDLYLPKGDGPFPVVICWFGGGFIGGDKRNIGPVAAFLAARGFATVAPNYFIADKAGEHPGWPRNVHDAKAAVRFVRAHAKDWHLDSTRIVGLGYSSGAYLALIVGFTPHLQELEGPGTAQGESSAILAVVDISGVSDRRGSLGSTTTALLGKGYEQKDDLRVIASPIIYVGPNTVPVFILQGDQDKTVDVSSARILAEALQRFKVPHQLNIVPAGHDPISAEAMESISSWVKERFSQ